MGVATGRCVYLGPTSGCSENGRLWGCRAGAVFRPSVLIPDKERWVMCTTMQVGDAPALAARTLVLKAVGITYVIFSGVCY